MIDKQEFYHGAAILRILEDVRCQSVQKHDFGYQINERIFVFLKYTTKSRSPWQFTFSREDVGRLSSLVSSYRKIVIALICGGDGICAVPWVDVEELIKGEAGWLSVRRNFNKRYGVTGPAGKLGKKVSRSEWPSVIFDLVSAAGAEGSADQQLVTQP